MQAHKATRTHRKSNEGKLLAAYIDKYGLHAQWQIMHAIRAACEYIIWLVIAIDRLCWEQR